MNFPKTIRLESNLSATVENYLKKNKMKFTQLVNLAIKSFISKPQSIELSPVDLSEWEKSATRAFKKHKDAMDKLK